MSVEKDTLPEAIATAIEKTFELFKLKGEGADGRYEQTPKQELLYRIDTILQTILLLTKNKENSSLSNFLIKELHPFYRKIINLVC